MLTITVPAEDRALAHAILEYAIHQARVTGDDQASRAHLGQMYTRLREIGVTDTTSIAADVMDVATQIINQILDSTAGDAAEQWLYAQVVNLEDRPRARAGIEVRP